MAIDPESDTYIHGHAAVAEAKTKQVQSMQRIGKFSVFSSVWKCWVGKHWVDLGDWRMIFYFVCFSRVSNICHIIDISGDVNLVDVLPTGWWKDEGFVASGIWSFFVGQSGTFNFFGRHRKATGNLDISLDNPWFLVFSGRDFALSQFIDFANRPEKVESWKKFSRRHVELLC